MDLLRELNQTLDFSVTMYKKKVKRWGNPIFNDNGSVSVGPGMVQDLFTGKVDMVATGMSLTLARSRILDFSHSLQAGRIGFYIALNEFTDGLDFDVYVRPYQGISWIMILMTIMMTSIFMALLMKLSNQRLLFQAWTLNLQSIFGSGDWTRIFTAAKASLKIVIITNLIVGNFFWIGHNAFLTSSLLEPIKRLPFNDLKTLLHSNWR